MAPALSADRSLADLTDKQVQLAAPTDSAEMRQRYFRPTPRVLHQLDSAIRVQAAGGPAAPERFYRRLTNGSNSHLPGFFMAYTILQNNYRPPCSTTPTTPFFCTTLPESS